jgi:hypothetical protein
VNFVVEFALGIHCPKKEKIFLKKDLTKQNECGIISPLRKRNKFAKNNFAGVAQWQSS